MKVIQLGLTLTLCTLCACSNNSDDNNDSDIIEEITGQWFLPCNVLLGLIGTETITFQRSNIVYEHQYYSGGGCTTPHTIIPSAEWTESYTFGQELTTSEGLPAIEINRIINWSGANPYTEQNIIAIINNRLYFGQFETEEDCDPEELIDFGPTTRPFCNERPTRLDFDRVYQRIE